MEDKALVARKLDASHPSSRKRLPCHLSARHPEPILYVIKNRRCSSNPAKRKSLPLRAIAGFLIAESEGKASSDLQDSGAVGLSRNAAQGGSAELAVRDTELHPVEEIESFYPEVECHVLENENVLVKRHIPVGDARRTQRVIGARLISVSEVAGLGEAARVENTCSWTLRRQAGCKWIRSTPFRIRPTLSAALYPQTRRSR